MQNLILYSLSEEDLKKLIKECFEETLEELHKRKLHNDNRKMTTDLIRLSEVARMLKVSKVTIHTWKRKGLIPFYRISNKIYFKKDEVIASLNKAKIRNLQ